MRKSFDTAFPHDWKERLDVDFGGREQRVTQGMLGSPWGWGSIGEVRGLDYLAHEGKAIRVQPGGGYAEKEVARSDVPAGKDLIALHGADGEASQIVVSWRNCWP